MADVPVLPLNDDWRVSHDERLQWVLERRDRPDRPPRASDNWRGRRFHVERDWLLVSIRELCGKVDPMPLDVIRSWPERYSPAFADAPQQEPDALLRAA